MSFVPLGESGGLTIEHEDGTLKATLGLALKIDGESVPLELTGTPTGDALVGVTHTRTADGTLALRTEVATDLARDALLVRVTAPSQARGFAPRVAIVARWLGAAPDVFVSGVGRARGPSEVSGTVAVIESRPHPVAVTSAAGPVLVRRSSSPSRGAEERSELTIVSPGTSSAGSTTDLRIVVGASSALVWQPLLEIARIPSVEVRGYVADALGAPTQVVGRDALGAPQVWALARRDGSFALRAPTSVVQWSATRGRAAPREMVRHVPGDPAPVRLEVAPKGGIHFVVRDADTGQPLTARLIVQRTDLDADDDHKSVPSSERATATGVRTLDALRGDATGMLSTGTYRVIATKGIEWSVDVRYVDVVSGQADVVELSLRHAVPTPGVVSCDLHTHARPSFDSRASPEDTVVSIVAAGIDFAVSTAHNIVSDYEPAAVALGLDEEFSSVPGVEITTYNPRFGHFGVFPVSSVPPFERTSLQAITRAVRSDGARYFQLNHPRLPGGIGYFDTVGLDPHAVRARFPERPDFDGIEVYNGFDIEHPARIDEVLRDYWALLDQGWRYTATGGSDSHCLRYHCVVRVLGHRLESSGGIGYPRTMVTVDPRRSEAGKDGEADLDPATIIENLKRGHATVTSGPLIDLTLDGAGPGDDVCTSAEVVRGHLRVRAAPWIDVSQVQIVAGRSGGEWQIVASYDVPGRPTQWGPGPGTLDEARAHAVRLDRDIAVAVGPTDGWVQAIARGTRLMSDVLPDVNVAPLAFTNPVYVRRCSREESPLPGSSRGANRSGRASEGLTVSGRRAPDPAAGGRKTRAASPAVGARRAVSEGSLE